MPRLLSEPCVLTFNPGIVSKIKTIFLFSFLYNPTPTSMKIKALPLVAVIFMALFFALPKGSSAQCSTRYIDSIFGQVDTTFNVVYTTTAGGGTQTLLLDVYTPHGDTAANRKLIVWAHGGAYFEGSKNDNDMQFLCTNFAHRGYVCASINYRLVSSVVLLYDSTTAFKTIDAAVNDMKASIRYFRKNAADSNTYRIDANQIYSGGGSAGAIMVDFATTIDSVGETPPYYQAIMDSNGGYEGNSGNPGYSSRVVAAASLAGGISNIDWIGPGNPPTFYAQGTADKIIPYECGSVFDGYTGGLIPGLFRLCGSAELEPQMASLHIPTGLQPFPGAGHVPWDSNQGIMNEVDSALAIFFYTLTCPLPTSVPEVTNANADVKVYPNPSNGQLHISVAGGNELLSITVTDLTGRQILKQMVSGAQIDVSLPTISAGVYTLQMQLKEAGINPVTKKIVIE